MTGLAPIAVLGGTALVGLTGFCWIIALLFSIQSLDDILGAAVPVLQIFQVCCGWSLDLLVPRLTSPAQDSFGLRGATAAFAINLVVLSFATIGILMASSRAVWSMARDGGFPLSRAFKKVDKRFDVPVNALLVQIFVPTILGLIYLGSTVIFYAFFQVAVVG